MQFRSTLALATLALLTLGLNLGRAQDFSYTPRAPKKNFRSAYTKPTTSPYLNLLREDFPSAYNYFTLVKPQVQQEYLDQYGMARVASLRNQLSADERPIDPRAGSPNVRSTGHRGRYMDYSNYYFRAPGQPRQ